MARIIDASHGRRLIQLSPEDVVSIVSHYQLIRHQLGDTQQESELIRRELSLKPAFLPESP